MSAYATAAAWAIGRLRATPAVTAVVPADRVFEGTAPTKALYPLILVQPYTDPVDTNFNGGRALTQVELLVRVWDSAPESAGGGIGRILPVELAMDAALSLTVPEATAYGQVAGCQRTAESPVTEPRTGETVRGLGGRWTVTVSGA